VATVSGSIPESGSNLPMKDAGHLVSGIRRNEPGLIPGIGSNL
jgi:hypothetical protein